MEQSTYWAEIETFAQSWCAALRSGRFDYTEDMHTVLANELRRHPMLVDPEGSLEVLRCSRNAELDPENSIVDWVGLVSEPIWDPAELSVSVRAACAFLLDAWDRMTELLGSDPETYVERRRESDRW